MNYTIIENGNKYLLANEYTICSDVCETEAFYGTYYITINSENPKATIKIKQLNGVVKILANLPILSIFFCSPYCFIYNETIIGKFSRSYACCEINMSDNIFHIRSHTNNYISLWKNNKQIGLISKGSKNQFNVNISNNEDTEILFSLLLFGIRILLSSVYMSNSKNIVYKDKFAFAKNWTTDD